MVYGLIGVVVLVAIVVGAVKWIAARRIADRAAAMAKFPAQRQSLAEPFREAASATGKPRGLRWVACELDEPTRFATDRATGELYAFTGVTISFEAIAGGGMEDVEAVSNLRSATAVFVHRGGRWATDGRVVFNLDPDQALAHFRDTIEAIGEGLRQRDAAG